MMSLISSTLIANSKMQDKSYGVIQRPVCLFPGHLGHGGIGRVVINLAQEFRKLDVPTDILLYKTGGVYEESIPEGVRIIHGHKRALTSIHALKNYIINENPFAVISSRVHLNMALIIAGKLARNDRTKIVISEHVHEGSAYRSRPLRIWINMISRLLYHHSDHAIAVSSGIKENILARTKLTKEDVSVIYNPVQIPDVLYQANRDPVVPHKWFGGDTPVIVSAGRMVKQKDFDTLLKAFAICLSNRPCRLIILGDGEERTNLIKTAEQLQITDYVDLPGHTKEIGQYLSMATLFVLSSAWEGFGNVIVEALSVGTPVVSTDCVSGPAEILDYGRYGRLAPIRNPKALADEILHALNEQVNHELLIQRANYFSPEIVAKRYLSAI